MRETICGAMFIHPTNQSSVCMLLPGHEERHEYILASALARGLHQTRVLLEFERGATARLAARNEDLTCSLRQVLRMAEACSSVLGSEDWFAVRDAARAALEESPSPLAQKEAAGG